MASNLTRRVDQLEQERDATKGSMVVVALIGREEVRINDVSVPVPKGAEPEQIARDYAATSFPDSMLVVVSFVSGEMAQ